MRDSEPFLKPTRAYYYAGSQRVAVRGSSAGLSTLYADHLGSASVAVSSAGTVSRQRYKPWGERRDAVGAFPTDRLYTGQIYDGDTTSGGTGLYFYNARYYDPVLGRFTQADTVVPDPATPLAFDRYAYSLNNPVKYADPRGHTPWDLVDVIFWGLSLTDFARNPSFANAGWLLLDSLSLLPVVPSTGYLRFGGKAGQVADEVIQFATHYGDYAWKFADIAHKKGAYTLLSKGLQAIGGDAEKLKGFLFELSYAHAYQDDIVEIGRRLPGGSEIDFVLEGNVFVNVKDYDWSKSFYQTQFGLQATIDDFKRQYAIYRQYSNRVKFVFRGSVPRDVREALEEIGAIVEIQ